MLPKKHEAHAKIKIKEFGSGFAKILDSIQLSEQVGNLVNFSISLLACTGKERRSMDDEPTNKKLAFK